MRRSRLVMTLLALLATVSCYGVNHTTYTIRTPQVNDPLATSRALAEAVMVVDPVAASSGLARTESAATRVHWLASNGSQRLELDVEASAGKVVVTLEYGRVAGWPSPEYRSARRELRKRLKGHFGESNVVIES